MRGKFAADQPGERFAFREEHWLQAQVLIDAAGRRRRRRFWWLFGVSLGLAGLCWWLFAGSGVETNSPGDSPGQMAELLHLPAEQSAANAGRLPSDKQMAGAVDAVATPVLPSEQPETAPEKMPVHPAGQHRQQLPSDTHSAGTQTARSDTPDQATASQPNRPVAGAAGAAGAGMVQPAGQETTSARSKPVPHAGLLLPVDLLPTSLQALGLSGLSPPLVQVPVSSPPPDRVRSWRWQLGLVASAATEIGHLQDEKPGIGAGITARLHRRGSAFSLNADLAWRWRGGTLGDSLLPAPVEQLRYGFGYELDHIEQQVTGTHWLELPLYLQYHLNWLSVSAGIAPTLLLAVRGEETRTRSSSLAPDPVTQRTARVHLENQYFSGLHLPVFAGLHWHPTDRLELGLRVQYQPGIQLEGSDAGVSGRRLGGGVQLRYFLKN